MLSWSAVRFVGVLFLSLILLAPATQSHAKTEIPIKIGDKDCGKAVVYVAGKDDPGGAKEGSLVFDFQGEDGREGCCKSYGWIQHVKRPHADTWRYDNAAWREGVTGAGIGAESKPEKETQPTEKDRPASGHWRENPWYGAPTDPHANKEEFAKNPKPQKKIGDKPGGDDSFLTQLICVDTGKVLLTWEWRAAELDKGKKVPPPK